MQLYPLPPRSEQIDDYHGTAVADPYRPLEDLDAPWTRKWIGAQARLTDDYLNGIPEREGFKRRLTALADYERRSIPVRYGDRYIYTLNSGLQNQAVWYQTPSLEERGSILIDPNTLSADGTVAVGAVVPTLDGALAGYALQNSGSDWLEWRVRRTSDTSDFPDIVRWSKFAAIAWLRDDSGFFYCRFPEPHPGALFKEENLNEQVVFHRLGTAQSDDVLVYARPDDPQLLFTMTVTLDGRYLLITENKGHGKNAVLYRDLREPDLNFVRLFEMDALWAYVHNEGSLFYFRTNKDAPRGKVISIDLSAPNDLTTVVPEGAEAIQSASVIGGSLFVNLVADVHSVLTVYALDGTRAGAVPLPDSGTAAMSGWADRDEAFISYADYTTPESILRYEVATGRQTLHFSAAPRFDRSAYRTEQVFVRSNDGTRVPMYVIAKEDIDRDGEAPAILYGYGGFDIAVMPGFSAFNIPWLERGGILAVVNLRGGSEYGREWHEAGMLERKQNVFDDFQAAARWLIDKRYTSARRLAVRGGSNGGLLVGAAITQRPELFGAAVIQVGVLDMLRYHKWTVGYAWIPEYGSAEDRKQFKTLFAYSPVHNLRRGAAYPPALIMTGDHDDRVFPAHSLKFAAALQEAQGSQAPILLRIETKAGHGAGTPLAKSINEWADIYAFLWRNLCS